MQPKPTTPKHTARQRFLPTNPGSCLRHLPLRVEDKRAQICPNIESLKCRNSEYQPVLMSVRTALAESTTDSCGRTGTATIRRWPLNLCRLGPPSTIGLSSTVPSLVFSSRCAHTVQPCLQHGKTKTAKPATRPLLTAKMATDYYNKQLGTYRYPTSGRA